MAGNIAVQSRMDNIAQLLRQQGYKVLDMQEASKPGIKIDAFLFTSNHPDILTSYNNLTNADNVSMDTGKPRQDPRVNTIMLNVTNLSAEQVLQELETRLLQQKKS